MRYGSVCSGIEAATVAWEPLGWEPAWFSEIEPLPCSVLAHHYPDVPNLGDITKITEADLERCGPIDVLVGGTPCQSFSVAGLRGGMADPRGNLALRFLQLARATRPTWIVWENVPGVLSSNEGRDFGSILGALAELGYGWAYRILDAQYFGVPQRRRRVFVVGYFGDWRRAAAVLFERESLCRNSPPSRETGAGVAGAVTRRIDRGGVNSEGNDGHVVAALTSQGVGTCGADDNQGQAGHLVAQGITARYRKVADSDCTDTLIAHSLRGEGFDASEDGTGRGTPLVPIAYRTTRNDGVYEQGDKTAALNTNTDPNQHVIQQESMAVRRLLPIECARLQGFPDDYLEQVTHRGKCPPADGPMYKAFGNSMAVPVMNWIGRRIAAAEST